MLIKHWETRVVKLSDVVPQKDNPRVINEQALAGLKASVGRFGLVELIVWNERTRFIISGHQRYQILLEKGVEETPMIVVDMSREDELAASLTMNNPKIEGDFDDPIMDLFETVEGTAPELFQATKMDDLKKTLERKIEINSGADDDVPDDGPLDGNDLDPEWDTECPCCGKKWKIETRDIIMAKGIQ